MIRSCPQLQSEILSTIASASGGANLVPGGAGRGRRGQESGGVRKCLSLWGAGDKETVGISRMEDGFRLRSSSSLLSNLTSFIWKGAESMKGFGCFASNVHTPRIACAHSRISCTPRRPHECGGQFGHRPPPCRPPPERPRSRLSRRGGIAPCAPPP